MHRILVLQGPNLNRLGAREPDIYGTQTLEEIHADLGRLAAELGIELEFLQSNHEGVLIDAIHQARGRFHGVLLNAGGLTHTSVALRDAIPACGLPVIEVHVSNPNTRETFRQLSLLAGVVLGVVQGFGADSYRLALRGLAGVLDRGRPA
jgi:3-dehydroquinate dehydratase-2